MSATLAADDRSGPPMKTPEAESARDRIDNEVQDDTQKAEDIRNGKKDEPWCPEGFYWGYNKQGDKVLKPSEWYVLDLAKDAELRFIAAIEKHGKSTELKERIERSAASLKEYLLERRAINDKAFGRRLKNEADDAAYQIVQAAKFRRDGIREMEGNRKRGYSPENQKTKDLRNWAQNSLYEGYYLTLTVLKAAEDSDFVPVFDYKAAAWRVCNWSAQRLTDTLMAKVRNESKSDKLEDEAAQAEAEKYFD